MSRLESVVKKAIEEAEKTGKLGFRVGRKFERVPLETFREVYRISELLRLGESADTINAQAMELCKYFGVCFIEAGIGWIAY